ncbi:hypothetical protein EI555_003924 [Monodon monoceros]|uniref:Radial spoke head 14 homolog n=1 Tax=Monodon monoceros TaxID=40151 RepID=A0A4U1EVW6_MONMO|nr:hypothetical protein EI555_003924 [Monodon monoceros]
MEVAHDLGREEARSTVGKTLRMKECEAWTNPEDQCGQSREDATRPGWGERDRETTAQLQGRKGKGPLVIEPTQHLTNHGRGGFAIYLVKYHPLASPPAPSTGDRWGVAHWPTLSARSCPAGAKGIVNSSLIPSLVWKLQREEERIQELLLDTLAACLMEDATEALASRAVPFLKEKLLSANSNIRSKAAQALTAVSAATQLPPLWPSIPLEGKNQVWQHDVIPILVHLLKDKEEEVQASAAGALMYVTVTTKGKYAALDTEAIRPLLELLHSSLSKARLNAIKVLTMLAEAPEGRKILQSHVPTFRALEEDTSAAVQRAAQIAVKVIEWKP